MTFMKHNSATYGPGNAVKKAMHNIAEAYQTELAARKGLAAEFCKFAQESYMMGPVWFESEPNGGYDSVEAVDIVAVPYYFVAKRLGISVSVCVETAHHCNHYTVTYRNQIVLEECDYGSLQDFIGRTDESFEEWVAITIQKWRTRLKIAKLLFG
jgi:hypothetical protein